MILILLLWFYMFFCFYGIGLETAFWIRTKNPTNLTISEILLFGIASTTLLCTFVSLFSSIDWAFYLFLFLVSFFSFWRQRTFALQLIIKQRLPRRYLILFLIYTLLVLMQSSVAPYFFDNDSYYLQTTKWIEEFGVVPGVANLHPFLGQMSPWHSIHAAFSFHFFGFDFNDINGFLAIIVAYTFFRYLCNPQLNQNQRWIIYTYFIFSPLWFRFIDSPSPDLVVYLLGFWLMVDLFSDTNTKTSFWLFGTPFAVFCKVLALPMLAFLLVFSFKKIKINRTILIWCGAFFFLFLAKNYLASGLPFYPYELSFLADFRPDWAIPDALKQTDLYKIKAFNIDLETLDQLNFFEKLTLWLKHPGLTGILNIGATSVFIIGLAYSVVWRNKKRELLFFLIAMAFFVFFLLSSPQPRFFLHWTLLAFALLMANWLHRFRLRFTFLPIGIGATILPLTLLSNVPFLSNNTYMQEIPTFQTKQILIPHERTKYPNLIYTKSTVNDVDVHHYSACDQTFVYLSFNADLPAVCPKLWQNYTNQFGLELEMRGATLSSGFRTRLSPN